MALIEALQKADDGNFLRSLAEAALQILMEVDVEGMIGAGRYERSGERSTRTAMAIATGRLTPGSGS